MRVFELAFVIARSTCDEAIHSFFLAAVPWIASLTLAMTDGAAPRTTLSAVIARLDRAT
jgi:hypothetical protein